MPDSTIHRIFFHLKNDVEIIFQGDDSVSHLIQDYRKIFSLNSLEQGQISEQFVVNLIHHPDCTGRIDLTNVHFDLINHKSIEIHYNFSKKDIDHYFASLMILSTIIGFIAQNYGGGLIHGALGELHGKGFLMAAPGGTGKSTASSRLPEPFVSLCDDTTLLMKDKTGKFWAHPFPTWSRFYWGGPGGSWNFNHVVPLHSIFYLSRSESNFISELKMAEKVSRCAAAFEQASRLLTRDKVEPIQKESIESDTKVPLREEMDWFSIGHDPTKITFRKIRMQWFENALIISQTIPSWKLNISLQGNFWICIQENI